VPLSARILFFPHSEYSSARDRKKKKTIKNYKGGENEYFTLAVLDKHFFFFFFFLFFFLKQRRRSAPCKLTPKFSGPFW
jgi:hypothetical protein